MMLNIKKSLNHTKNQLIILVLLTFGLNANTLFNDYALDDAVVMTGNNFVQKGIKGIPEIITNDYVSGYTKQENILTGVRYRPFSLILFAIEYQFFGTNPFISHLINVILFTLLILLLYKLLQTFVTPEQSHYLPFATCLLFAVHPIHSEVIANVKSRDEIITFILLITSLISIIKFYKTKKSWMFINSLFLFFFALLTKETAVTFIGVVPLTLYFFSDQSIKRSLRSSLPFILIFIGYLTIRYFMVGFKHYPVNDVTNAPYLYATYSQALATKFYVLIKYIGLLFFPYPLSSDYGYNQVPYINLISLKFFFSLIILSGILYYAINNFKKRAVLSFCILFFFATLSVGSNFIIDLGTIMAERMLFQSSLAACIAMAFLFMSISKSSNLLANTSLLILLALFSIKTFSRNREWKNNETLILSDVISSPNSARMNLYACEQYIIKANKTASHESRNNYINKAVFYGEQSLKIQSTFAYSFLKTGIAYYYQNNYERSADLMLQALKRDSIDPEIRKWTDHLSDIFYKQGNGQYEERNFDKAIANYRKSINLNANNTEAWYNLGGIYFLKNDTINANNSWEMVRKINPTHPLNKKELLK